MVVAWGLLAGPRPPVPLQMSYFTWAARKRLYFGAAVVIPAVASSLWFKIQERQEQNAEHLRLLLNERRRLQSKKLAEKQILALEEGSRPENRSETLQRALEHVGPWAPNQQAKDNAKEAREVR